MERASGATTATAADSEADDDDAMVTVFCWDPLLIFVGYGNDKDRGTPRYRADDE